MFQLEPEILEAIASKQVLVLWGPGCSTEELEALSKTISSQSSKVTFENAERLSLAKYSAASYDVVLSNFLAPYSVDHSFELVSEIIKLLKPNGVMFGKGRNLQNTQTSLTLAGFCNISVSSKDPPTISASKPNFEVGSSSKLAFAKPSVWSLADDLMDEDIDLVNQDELLEESDLLKPAADSLRVCGTTGKRKACKDCSCGLAEELADDKGSKTTETKVTSSCGSCYLGDAFRCASCPYLGMPAFKPGEKIKLAE